MLGHQSMNGSEMCYFSEPVCDSPRSHSLCRGDQQHFREWLHHQLGAPSEGTLQQSPWLAQTQERNLCCFKLLLMGLFVTQQSLTHPDRYKLVTEKIL